MSIALTKVVGSILDVRESYWMVGRRADEMVTLAMDWLRTFLNGTASFMEQYSSRGGRYRRRSKCSLRCLLC